MECHADPQTDCENCVLCAVSTRAHSWNNSGRAFLEAVRQKGKTGGTYVVQIITERSSRFEEAHPKASKFLGIVLRKIICVCSIAVDNSKKAYQKGISSVKNAYTCAGSAVHPSAQRIKQFFIQNSIRCYFCGGVLLIAGTFLFVIPSAITGSSNVALGSAWLLFVAAFAILVPICYWMRIMRHYNRLEYNRRQVQMMDKPPPYESLSPAYSPLPPTDFVEGAPPTYEEICAERQEFLIYRVPPCAIHQPTLTSTHNVQEVTDAIAVSSSICHSSALHPLPSGSQTHPTCELSSSVP